MKVTVYGESAIVTGVENVGGRYPAGPLKGQLAEFAIRFTNVFVCRISTSVRYTRVYVNRDGRWQAVQFQQTRVPPPA